MVETPKFEELVGVVHIHTKDSDGNITHDEAIALGQKYKLDFLMFSDHMTLEHKNKEGWHDKTLVIVGYEHNDQAEKNHYLVFGLKDVLPTDLTSKMYVRRVRQAGGFGFAAHPFEKRNSQTYPPLEWTDWAANEFDGFEIWNHMSSWLEGISLAENLLQRVKYLLNPRSLISAPPPEALAMWDKIARHRRCAGIGSADAHGFKLRFLKIFWRTIFPYPVEFNSIRTHVLLRYPLAKDFAPARDTVLNAMRSCRIFISNVRWGDARGFRFWAQSPRRIAGMGDLIPVHSQLKMFVDSPLDAEIRLIKDGEQIAHATGRFAEFEAKKPGSYRVELWRDGNGWVFSNHIKVERPQPNFPPTQNPNTKPDAPKSVPPQVQNPVRQPKRENVKPPTQNTQQPQGGRRRGGGGGKPSGEGGGGS